MAKLSLNQAWTETAAFVKREARLLFPIALLFSALPSAAMTLIMPQAENGQLPEPGLWLLLLPLAGLIGMIGSIALATLALRPGLSVGEAIGNGLRRMPILFAAMLMLGVAVGILLLIVSTIAVLLFVGQVQNPAPEALLPAILVVVLLFLPLALFLAARFLVTTPVAAAETVGPIALLRRSWDLTRGSTWTLIGFLLLIGLVLLVVMIAVGAVLGILIVAIAGRPEAGNLAGILTMIVQAAIDMVISVYVTVLVARIYTQLTGNVPEDVFA